MEKLLLASERTHEFELKTVVQGEEVKGKFKIKYPSVLDEIEIQKDYSNLLKGANPDTLMNAAFDLFYIVARNKVLLLEYPEWYNLEVLDNTDIIYDINEEIEKFIDNFRKGNGKAGDSKDSNESKDKTAVASK